MTGPRRVPLLTATLVATAMAVAGCGTAVRHPLDDSETRPASPWAATTEAAMTLDELGESTMSSLSFTSQEWVPDSGCDTYPEAPEQGDVGRVLARSYDALPGGRRSIRSSTTRRRHGRRRAAPSIGAVQTWRRR